MTAKAKTLSKDKLALIHVAKTQIGMVEEDYRSMLQAVAGVASAKELSPAGFLAVMQHLERLGFSRNHAKADGGRRTGMATPEQMACIRKMWTQWSGQDDEQALRHWLERKYQVSALRFTDVATAKKAIEGLKAMLSRRQLKDKKQ